MKTLAGFFTFTALGLGADYVAMLPHAPAHALATLASAMWALAMGCIGLRLLNLLFK